MPLQLTKELIERPSITPDDAGCQDLIAQRLIKYGFSDEPLNCNEVHNRWLRRGQSSPLFVFAGHTDVVPVGDELAWTTPPFIPTEKNNLLYGRGAADMKGGVAAMTIACERFVKMHPHHHGSIALLLTSDEEGVAVDGTRHVMQILSARNEHIDWCLIAEPSSTEVLGDTIRNGRRGSLSGKLRIKGKQGHIAYPDKAVNPIHAALTVLNQLCKTEWDCGNDFFPPTSFQLYNIHADGGANNIIPGNMEVGFNLRFSPEITEQDIYSRIENLLDASGCHYEIDWHLSGHAFLTEPDKFVTITQEAIHETVNIEAKLSTGGGTSDGRFIAPYGVQVLELGLVNKTIHQVDEHTRIEDLYSLVDIYHTILKKILL